MEGSRPDRLARPDGTSIAYHRTSGKSPGVVFMGGFMSDMTGTKALALEAWAKTRGRAFLRFDYRGHGTSSGRFEDHTIGDWAEDAALAFDRLTEGPQLVVGSSMGGWIALLTARTRAPRIVGLTLIACAADFTEDLLLGGLSPTEREELMRDGLVRLASDYGGAPYIITKSLIEDGRRHLLLGAPIAIGCPVRLLHGMRDPDVPWQRSLAVAERLESEDVRMTLVKDGDHRLSRDQDLRLLTDTLEEMLAGAG